MSKDFFKRIMVAINGSEASIHAAMYAIIMARSYNLKLKAVYVVDTATIKYLSLNKFLIDEEKNNYEDLLSKDGDNYLKYIERLALTKGIKIETELLSGGVYSEILKAADKFDADLLLVGGNEKGEGKQHKSSASSDEKNLLLSSPIPVMFVQKPEIERLFKSI